MLHVCTCGLLDLLNLLNNALLQIDFRASALQRVFPLSRCFASGAADRFAAAGRAKYPKSSGSGWLWFLRAMQMMRR